MNKVDLEEGDLVLAMSDGVVDNLWEHEVVQNVVDSFRKWESREVSEDHDDEDGNGMPYVAQELVKAARVIAEDPFAESPFMERAVDEGLAMEGGMSTTNISLTTYTDPYAGKLDDISVVAAICKRRKG